MNARDSGIFQTATDEADPLIVREHFRPLKARWVLRREASVNLSPDFGSADRRLAPTDAREAFAFGHQFLEQRRNYQPFAATLRAVILQLLQCRLQANLMFGPEHRATTIGREPVTIQVNDVDVAGAIRHSLTQHFAALVYQCQKTPLGDFLVANLAAFDTALCRYLFDEFRHHTRRPRRSVAGRVIVIAGLSFLAQPPHFHQ